jgi:hypothetical protein
MRMRDEQYSRVSSEPPVETIALYMRIEMDYELTTSHRVTHGRPLSVNYYWNITYNLKQRLPRDTLVLVALYWGS